MRPNVHAQRSITWLLALCWLLSLRTPLGHSQAQQPQTPLRLVARVTADDDQRALLTRVRGQLSDLDVTLIVIDSAAIEPSFRLQLEAAQQLASAHDAAVVIWFDVHHGATGLEAIVHIATPGSDRVATRRIHTDGNQDASGLLEGAALVVRSATRALSEGGVIGVSREQAIADSLAAEREVTTQDTTTPAIAATSDATSANATATPSAPTTATTSAPSAAIEEERADESVTSSTLRVRGLGLLGVRVVVDRISPLGQWGAHGHAGIALGSLVLLARGTFSVGSTLRYDAVELRLSRHDLGGAVGVWLAPTERWQLLLFAQASAVFYRRSTETQNASARATHTATLTSATFGPALSLSFMPSPIGIVCEVGLDVMLAPPRFALAGSAASRVPAPIAPSQLQPYASIGVGARFP